MWASFVAAIKSRVSFYPIETKRVLRHAWILKLASKIGFRLALEKVIIQ